MKSIYQFFLLKSITTGKASLSKSKPLMFERQSLNEQNNKNVRRNILFELGAQLFGLTKRKTCDDYIIFANCLGMLDGFCTVGHANIRLVIQRTLSDS